MERRNFLKRLGFGAAALIPGAAILAKGSAKGSAEAAAAEAIPIPTLPPKETAVIPEYWAKESLRILMEQEEYRKTISRDRREITDEGVNYALDTAFTNKPAADDWYVGLIDSNGFTATQTDDTLGDHPGWAFACDEAFQPLQKEVKFDITRSATIKGCFVASPSKQIVYSTMLFNQGGVSVVAGDQLKINMTVEGLI